MRTIDPGNRFDTWRNAARHLLLAGVPPSDLIWQTGAAPSLFPALPAAPATAPSFPVPRAFVDLARHVACHESPERWPLLYRLLWRLLRDGQRHLLQLAGDPDVSAALRMEKSVRREIHKTHAFVRFRRSGESDYFTAWFEPVHFIVEPASPFFARRFANMDWSLFTPKGCSHWSGGRLSYTDGVACDPYAHPDAVEELWKTYYGSIFNPARLKMKAMQAEMPKRYWKNLPETELIRPLLRNSRSRVAGMFSEIPRAPRPLPHHPYLRHLRGLSDPSAR